MKWDIVDRSVCYQGFFQVDRIRLRHSLYAGGQSPVLYRECVSHASANGAVAVLPYDPQRDRVVLIEQFRTGALESPQGPWMVEIVAGLVEIGERPCDAARRETLEEIGCSLNDLVPIHEYYSSPGGFNERISLFLGLLDSGEIDREFGGLDDDEDIRISVINAREAMEMISAGLITSAQPIIALQWLQLNRNGILDGILEHAFPHPAG